MERKSSSCLMSTIHLCRRHIQTDTGKNLLPLQEVFLTRLLRQIHILERAIMTGITRVSKRKYLLVTLNNLVVVTTTSNCEYEKCIWIYRARKYLMHLMSLSFQIKKMIVKSWYDGFTFGDK